jgi:hypothetical protein
MARRGRSHFGMVVAALHQHAWVAAWIAVCLLLLLLVVVL